MRLPRFTLFFVLAVLTVAVPTLSGCDLSEQPFDYEPGNSLDIEGAVEVTVPDTTEYFVRAFTIKKDYSWTIEGGEGAEIIRVRREGEYIDVAYTEPGTYTISIASSGQGDNYTGELEVTASEPE